MTDKETIKLQTNMLQTLWDWYMDVDINALPPDEADEPGDTRITGINFPSGLLLQTLQATGHDPLKNRAKQGLT